MFITARNSRRYNAILSSLLTFVHQPLKPYEKNHKFTNEELNDITHEQVLGYFYYQCFGDQKPVIDENLRANYRKSTVLYWKKALSHFLKDNQTKSDEMNKLTKLIGQLEVRKMGKASQAREALNDSGFQHLLQILKKDRKDGKKKDSTRSNMIKYGFPAMLCYQFSMIGRLDDCTQLLAENVKVHDKFPSYALKSRLTWSKNVMDERDAPFQMLLGSLLTVYCVFVNIGIWLEIQLETTSGAILSPYVFSFSGVYNVPEGGKKASAIAGKMIGDIFRDDLYYKSCKVGTHSIRKFATTSCRDNGVSHDDVEHRGRWKDSRRVSNRYVSPVLPFVDANACVRLCQGGACTYVPKPGCVTQDFLCTHVVPLIAKKFDPQVAMILGSALMWTIFSSHSDMVPAFISARVIKAYDMLPNKFPDGQNPIEQRKLYLVGEGNNFRLASGSDNEHEQSLVVYDSVGDGGNNDHATRDFLNVNMNQLTEVRQGQIELVDTVNKNMEIMKGQILQLNRTMITKINRISRQPHRMMYAAANDAITAAQMAPAPADAIIVHPTATNPEPVLEPDLVRHAAGLHATLSPGPRNLYALWQEWYFGIDGRKPAKDFTARESGGHHKVTYCNRKKFWVLAEHLIRSGCTADDACKKIYDAYGHTSTVTSILKRIAKDNINGTIPNSLR